MFVTVTGVDLCASVDGGQHHFFFFTRECWTVSFCFYRSGSGVITAISKSGLYGFGAVKSETRIVNTGRLTVGVGVKIRNHPF